MLGGIERLRDPVTTLTGLDYGSCIQGDAMPPVASKKVCCAAAVSHAHVQL